MAAGERDRRLSLRFEISKLSGGNGSVPKSDPGNPKLINTGGRFEQSQSAPSCLSQSSIPRDFAVSTPHDLGGEPRWGGRVS